MRYRTFIRIQIAVAIVLLVIGVKVCTTYLVPTRNSDISSVGANSQTNTTTNTNSPSGIESVKHANSKPGDKVLDMTPIDNKVIELQQTQVTQVLDKSGKNYKKFMKFPDFIVDLRCDFTKGFSSWNRIKVDFDKDKNYDEKWTFRENGQIVKEISSSDNETYDYEYILKGTTWQLR